jgi:methionyl-tRNA formyltransferase
MPIIKNRLNIAIITEKNNWFDAYRNTCERYFKSLGHRVKFFYNHNKSIKGYDLVFLLSYLKIVNKKFLSQNKHNIVIHESNLPKGKGWAPLFWQIIKGKNKIVFTTFEANENIDDGNYYFKDILKFRGDELYDEIRDKQAQKRFYCCRKIISNFDKLKSKKQIGQSTFFKRRTKKDSELNINRSIKSQFNLLRSVDNDNFPAFFYHKKFKYFVKIFKEKK